MVRRVFRAIWLSALATSVTFVAARAQSKEGLGAVTGRVLCSDTQQPARLAHVVLQPVVDPNSPLLDTGNKSSRPEGIFHLQTVGLDGSFTIPAVPPGHYYVIAEQDGYVSPLALFTREQLNNADEQMQRKIARYMTPISVTAGAHDTSGGNPHPRCGHCRDGAV